MNPILEKGGWTNNSVHKHEGHWWFWNEIWSDRVGPYETEEEACTAVNEYAAMLNEKPKGG